MNKLLAFAVSMAAFSGCATSVFGGCFLRQTYGGKIRIVAMPGSTISASVPYSFAYAYSLAMAPAITGLWGPSANFFASSSMVDFGPNASASTGDHRPMTCTGYYLGGHDANFYWWWRNENAHTMLVCSFAGQSYSVVYPDCISIGLSGSSGSSYGTVDITPASTAYSVAELDFNMQSDCTADLNRIPHSATRLSSSALALHRTGIAVQGSLGTSVIQVVEVGGMLFAPPGTSLSTTFSGPLFDGYYHVGTISGDVTNAIGSSGSISYSATPFAFELDRYDLNGDGKFTDADADWLSLQIPSTDPTLIMKANFVTESNASGSFDSEVVDSSDLEYLQNLIDWGLGSPLFGDRLGDGCITCADSYHDSTDLDGLFGGTLATSSSYKLELDSNLDGVLDSSDRIAFYAAVNHADFTGDGLVDDADFTIFTGYYDLIYPPVAGTSGGDQNGDGICDDADFIIFAARYDTLVCPSCS